MATLSFQCSALYKIWFDSIAECRIFRVIKAWWWPVVLRSTRSCESALSIVCSDRPINELLIIAMMASLMVKQPCRSAVSIASSVLRSRPWHMGIPVSICAWREKRVIEISKNQKQMTFKWPFNENRRPGQFDGVPLFLIPRNVRQIARNAPEAGTPKRG